MAGTWQRLRKAALHRKVYHPDRVEDTKLRRCLIQWDLSALGAGSTLGVGIYLLIGHVALNYSGPSIVLSFLIAAVAALCAGVCFAEFSARIPRAGAAYNYTYLALGEALAFLIGWCNILEYSFGSASVARGLSMHVDRIFNCSMTDWFTTFAPMSVPFMSPFFDFFACSIVLVMGSVLSFGVRPASLLNSLASGINVSVILMIIIFGAFAADSSHWAIPIEEVPPGQGRGGFFPFGIWGTLQGAAVCFYCFVGFDSVCSAGEEVREPRRVIPTTILLVLIVTLVGYCGVAIVVTMMVPYYLHDPFSAVAEAFSYVGWSWAKWIITLAALLGMYTSLFGAMFPLPRLLYAMSADGFLGRCFGKLTSRQSPAVATLVPTFVIGALAGLCEVDTLVATMCTGTLFSYTAVATGVMVMRYRSDYTPGSPKYLRQVFGVGRSPTLASARVFYVSLVLFFCVCISSALVTSYVDNLLIPSATLHGIALILLLIITAQPQNKEALHFKTPLVPLMPCLSIYFNIHLMVIINGQTWIRAAVWIAMGIIIYLLTFCCCKKEESNLKDNMTIVHAGENGKVPVQIIVESPTPPDTIARTSNYGGDIIKEEDEIQEDIQESVVRNIVPLKSEEIVIHQAYIENNEEKEAKIIDLLDQVLQAEEDTYGEVKSLKEQEEQVVSTAHETAVHRKSLGELSDAGSDASLGNPVLSKYDVIAQVHREDLSRVNEESDREGGIDDEDQENMDIENLEQNMVNDVYEEDNEQVTAFNDSDTNSRTDESGYSDTIDRNALSESLEVSKEDIPYIPVPPPLDESYFGNSHFKKSYTMPSKHSKPPPSSEDDEERRPRESVTSNSTLGEDNITFGSDRQVHFMSKLNNIFQTKISNNDEEEPRRRSHSTGNVVDNTEYSMNRDRSPMFLALKTEIISKDAAQNLRPVITEEKAEAQPEDDDEAEDVSMTREDLKFKLENIFATGGPQLLKPRLIKSNPPTPEDSYQTETSSTESMQKQPKMEKNDTLKRQKAKFSAVLDSFMLSFNKDDVV